MTGPGALQRPGTSFSRLRQIASRPSNDEQCELCGAPLAVEHPHLMQLESRQLVCACDPCALLFSRPDAGKYRRVPRTARLLRDFRLSDADWDALRIPVAMAFLFHNSTAGRVMAYYPSPAGATESLLPLETWQALVRDNPVLETLEPDVEALLVNRVGQQREYFAAPIDRCYALVGVIRMRWHGLSGGTEVWRELAAFFERLRQQARVVSGASHA